jgi:hypothetical protein
MTDFTCLGKISAMILLTARAGNMTDEIGGGFFEDAANA